MVAAADANHATPTVHAGRPSKIEDDFVVLKSAQIACNDAVARLREARQIASDAARTKIREAVEQAAMARGSLDEFLDGRRDVRSDDTFGGRDFERNRTKLRGLYSERRAKGVCVKCQAPALVHADGTPQARCEHHTRLMRVQMIKRELALEINDSDVPAIAALALALDELAKLEVPAHAERIVSQMRAFVESWGR